MAQSSPVFRTNETGLQLFGKLYSGWKPSYVVSDNDAEFRMRRDPLFELSDASGKKLNLAEGIRYTCPHCGGASHAMDMKRSGDMDSVMCPICRTYCLVEDWAPIS